MKPIRGTVNFVELIGWLGADPELRYTPSGVPVAEFSVGTKRLANRNEDGSWNYDTDWIDVVAWDQLAENVAANLRKGRRVRITGSLKTDTWEDRDGHHRKRITVRADDIIFLDARTTLDEATVDDASA